NGAGSCLKHFPGYGSNADTHTGISVDKRSAESFREKDFIPFEYGINVGVSSVMVCHNIVEAFDSERPASLSVEVHRILREELGFKGVIISDDMGMDAIKLYSGGESPYVLAVLAGNDLVCTSDIPTAYEAILAAVKDGRIPEEAVDESCIRILEMKEKLAG
ncbi:MAG: glycoside hydrolase family 3 N-terminal domain-containing protein, partial [Huintestinicola sp.]